MEQVRVNGIFCAKPDNGDSMYTFHGGKCPGGNCPSGEVNWGELSGRELSMGEVPGGESIGGNFPGVKCLVTLFSWTLFKKAMLIFFYTHLWYLRVF